ncbi:DUF1542 domain-containing protein [Atopobacter phocae]|uniref:DUF1542 domain-containing protein n=1 Tax=Atopobacter phocae TaxID=136492 RepID=UPI000472A5B8|nr:DUF1542 domain-containing protein [Atopobacter phocae]
MKKNQQNQPKYTIRKLSIGVASCLIGLTILESHSLHIQASEPAQETVSNLNESQTEYTQEKALKEIKQRKNEKIQAFKYDKRYTTEEKKEIEIEIIDYIEGKITEVKQSQQKDNLKIIVDEIDETFSELKKPAIIKLNAKTSIENQKKYTNESIDLEQDVTTVQKDNAKYALNTEVSKAIIAIDEAESNNDVEQAKVEGLYNIQKIKAALQPLEKIKVEDKNFNKQNNTPLIPNEDNNQLNVPKQEEKIEDKQEEMLRREEFKPISPKYEEKIQASPKEKRNILNIPKNESKHQDTKKTENLKEKNIHQLILNTKRTIKKR